MDLTPAYETICDIIVDNENIITVKDLRNHLETTDLVYTEDDILLAYNWSGQAVQRIMEYNKHKSLLLKVKPVLINLYKYKNNWFVSFPSIPGCHTSGKTLRKVRKNIKEAVIFYLEDTPLDIDTDLTKVLPDYEKQGKYFIMKLDIPVKDN